MNTTKRSIFYLVTTLALYTSFSVTAETTAYGDSGARTLEEVVVTARRRAERLQDVPVSMTVFSQEDVSNLNIVNAGDLAAYTPSLTVNDRFGQDNTTFAIRGFTEALRTTASVGVYFADVVAPRGANITTSGNGAGPGAFFDLQNVQVLKGPQGTLFGRNTTGGAVLIVPQKPTEEFEGYVEGSAGNLDLRRRQAVINLPVSESVRLRFGFDDHKRDGYLKNEGTLGPHRLNDLDYTAFRASLVVDINDNLENYTIVNHTDSSNKGNTGLILACHPDSGFRFASFCQQQLPTMSGDFYGFKTNHPDHESSIEQSQIINHFTWEVSDKLTAKSILSYTKLNTTYVSSTFATDFYSQGRPFWMTSSDMVSGFRTTDQDTFVAELQFQGYSFDDRLDWQAGLYYERSKPDDTVGSLPTRGADCRSLGPNPASWECLAVLGPAATISRQLGEVEYDNRAVYGQGTYSISDNLKVTAGLRYTWDETKGVAQGVDWSGFPAAAYGPPANQRCINPLGTLPDCTVSIGTKSDEPTWVLGLEYSPVEDVMLYAKYSRGYRQGNVNLFGAPGFQVHDPETLDTYEIGSKTSFDGLISGTFNAAIFYNELRDMQLQTGFGGIVNTTGILNAGEAVMQGVELESSLNLFDGFVLHLGYTYLDTEIKKIAPPPPPPPGLIVVPAGQEGDPTPWSPKNKLTATASYRLPLPISAGDVTVALNYVYVDEQLVTTGSPFGVLPSHELFNITASWSGIAGSNFDASLFVTNVKDTQYASNVYGLYSSFGAEFYNPGPPRMLGVRLKYNF